MDKKDKTTKAKKAALITFNDKEYEAIKRVAEEDQRSPTELIRIAILKYIDYKENWEEEEERWGDQN